MVEWVGEIRFSPEVERKLRQSGPLTPAQIRDVPRAEGVTVTSRSLSLGRSRVTLIDGAASAIRANSTSASRSQSITRKIARSEAAAHAYQETAPYAPQCALSCALMRRGWTLCLCLGNKGSRSAADEWGRAGPTPSPSWIWTDVLE